MVYYSALANGFFAADIHCELPEDAIEISSEQHKALLDGQSNGKVITADADGRPILVDPPGPTESELAEMIRVKRDRNLTTLYAPATQQLSRWIDEAEEEGSTEALAYYKTQRAAWHAYADALCDLPEKEGFPWAGEEVPWPVQPEKPHRFTQE